MISISPKATAGHLIDTCGTGGDGRGTFNISTCAAIVASACGAKVAKHGNRASSSKTGSADVLEELGIKITVEPHDAERMIETHGFAFLFAPAFHPAMKNVASIRKELGFRTVFNILGPLANPANVKGRLSGFLTGKLQGKWLRLYVFLELSMRLLFPAIRMRLA